MPSPTRRTRGSSSMASTGIALRNGDLKISDPIPLDHHSPFYPTFNALSPTAVSFSAHHDSHDQTSVPAQTGSPLRQNHVRHASDFPTYTARVSAGPSLLPSSMASVPSNASLEARGHSGWRAALKRMFASKKHRSVPVRTDTLRDREAGRLDPLENRLLGTTGVDSPHPHPHLSTSSSPTPGPSLTPLTALTSHATHDDVERDHADMPLRGGAPARRNTLPNLGLGDREARLEPFTGPVHDPPFQPNHKSFQDAAGVEARLKRRSRSADAWTRMSPSDHRESWSGRDRTGEIAYWRNSVIEHPVPTYSGQTVPAPPNHATPGGDDDDAAAAPSDPDPSPVHPMQTFDFGLGDPDRHEISLEERMNTLEIKMFDFEYAIAKLQGANVVKPDLDVMALSHSHSHPAVHHVYTDSETTSEAVSVSSQPSRSLTPSTLDPGSDVFALPHHVPPSFPDAAELFRPQRASKATTVTIRPSTATRRSSRSADLSWPRYQALLDLLDEERRARERLQVQISELRQEIGLLKAPVYARVQEYHRSPAHRGGPDHPTKTLHRTQGFNLSPATHEISRFSTTDTESESEDGFEDVYEAAEERRPTFESARDMQHTGSW